MRRPGPPPATAADSSAGPGAEPGVTTAQLVLGVGVLMIVAQAAFRGWALFRSWYYADDYRLLNEALQADFGLRYLSTPFDSQFMPVGRALVYLVADPGQLHWSAVATVTLVLQLLAGASCLWMLITLFGSRWGVLAPLGLYLSNAMTMSGLLWWAASLNQLPFQSVFFCTVACWVTYLRTRRARWLSLTCLTVVVGLLCYVKTVFVLPVLLVLLLAYFTSGPGGPRLRSAVARYWPAALALVAVGGAFGVYYVTQVPSVLAGGDRPVGALADAMLGRAWTTGALGGPWRWDPYNPPVAYASPLPVVVHLSWVVLAVGGIYLALRRRRTGRAWALLGGYLVLDYLLLLTTRAPFAGAVSGVEYRYLTDSVGVLALCLGLATMPVLGSVESSEAREVPLLAVRIPTRVVAGLAVLLCLSGIYSSTTYARIWHSQNPGKDYFRALTQGMAGRGPVDLPDQFVPDDVMNSYGTDYNTTRVLVPLAVSNARFPDVTADLAVLTDSGQPRRAVIDPGLTSPPGPAPDCGWRVRGGSTDIPLGASTYDVDGLWLRIGYLASAESPAVVSAGRLTVTSDVRRGLGSLFVRMDGAFDSVRVSGLDPGVTMCVDTIEIGRPVDGGTLR